jgi:hypothetical protein
MSDFKIGDEVLVKSLDYYEYNFGVPVAGMRGAVTDVDEDRDLLVKFSDGQKCWFKQHEVVLLGNHVVSSTTKYETKLVKLEGVSSTEYIEYRLDSYGAEGWELKAIDYGCFILQRIKR